jgi:hypothetical protein
VSRRLILKVLAAATVFGAVFAMAATLGVSSETVGAGDAAVASCDTDGVTTGYAPAWDAGDERYEVATVTIKGIAAACNGKAAKVTLTGSSGASLGEGTATLSVGGGDTTDDVTVAPAAAAADVTGVHVVIAD